MCGIAGVVGPRVSWGAWFADLAIQRLAHRGPDGTGRWFRDTAAGGPDVTFAHTRLAVIDVRDSAAQPMHTADGSAALVFNGEIYNFVELRTQLECLGQRFRTASDSEVLLAAYRVWGEKCVDHLNGMFAFAIWDERSNRLFAARDRLGEKPFHYVWDPTNGVFAFASEIKALVGLPGLPVGLCESALAQWAGGASVAAGVDTLIDPVRRLAPGHMLSVQFRDRVPNAPEVHCYWALPDDRLDVGVAEAGTMLRDALRESVRIRLRSDVPIGSSLSGGLDSSMIVGLIRDLRSSDAGVEASAAQHTFTARMEEPHLDEGRWVDMVTAANGVANHQVWPRHGDLVEHYDRWIAHLEEPVSSTSPFAQYLVMRLAAEHGVTVLLDGQGADEQLAGYTSYFLLAQSDLLARRRLLRFASARRDYGRLQALPFPLTSRMALARLFPHLYGRWRVSALAEPEPLWSHDWVRSAGVSRGSGDRPSRGDALRQRLRADTLEGPLQDLLRFGDRNSMAWGREVRAPFLDHRVVELTARFPDSVKISGGRSKVALRSAAAGVVPDAIVHRHDKLGYQAPMVGWLSGPLGPWTEERLETAVSVFGHRIEPNLVDGFRSRRPSLDAGWANRYFSMLTAGGAASSLLDLARNTPAP
jgi:asparagine synthase (glutamine-hydrolysing)